MTLALTDGNAFNNASITHVDTFTYSRKYTSVQWVTTVLPVALNYSDWSSKFEIADITDVNVLLDTDGKLKSFNVTKTILKSGATIVPNKPYLIKAKTASTTAQVIKKTNCDVYPSVPEELIITKGNFKFIFKGTYVKVSAEEMNQKYYSTKETWKQSTGTTSVGSFRVYLTIVETPKLEVPAPVNLLEPTYDPQMLTRLIELETRVKKLEEAIGDLNFKVE